MSWLTELVAVYDNTFDNTHNAPLPIYHMVNNVVATITLDQNGTFINAEIIEDKDEKPTCMPCTESCTSRSSGIDPYPLCDTLEYLAILENFNTDKDKQNNKEKHEKYVNLLESWVLSEKYSHIKVKAVYEYIKSGQLVSDLKEAEIWDKIEDKNFIRWAVEIPKDVQPELWKDTSVQNAWIDFYNSDEFDKYCKEKLSKEHAKKRIRKIGLDYCDGDEKAKITEYHQNKIRHQGDKAKIISSNDTENYTYRGRFHSADEACQISSITSQKAHNALRWLIARQGTRLGEDLVVVSWNKAGDKLPSIVNSSRDIDDDIEYHTAREFAETINKKLKGYYGDTSHPENIMILCLDSAVANQGRLAISMYREYQNTDLIESLNTWYTRLSWFNSWYDKDKKAPCNSIGTPSPKQIAECAYGSRVKDKVIKKTVKRILPCILDGAAIPKDIETQCIKSASNLLIIEKNKRNNILETACAVYKYNNIKQKNEEYIVALEETRTNRDYLFGRLLAVAQKMEEDALHKMEVKRETNAIRYMRQFSLKPSSTWKILSEKLIYYRKHLNKGSLINYDKTIQTICNLFDYDDFTNDEPLSGAYLLGYHCQLKKLWEKKSDNNNNETLNEEPKQNTTKNFEQELF
ncbi:MAG: type I-C CRISPR-associated protein Cas8c/Csd1 [Treponemataceae bacterium]